MEAHLISTTVAPLIGPVANDPDDDLSPADLKRFYDLEREVVTIHQHGYARIGRALTTIRDERLYRVRAETFEQYVRHQFGMSRAGAYRHINVVEVLDDLKVFGVGVSKLETLREAALRPLTRIPRTERTALRADLVTCCDEHRLTASAVERLITEKLPAYTRKRCQRDAEAWRRRLKVAGLEARARSLADDVRDLPVLDRQLVLRRAEALTVKFNSRPLSGTGPENLQDITVAPIQVV